jgi:hypothetical protein
MRLVGRPYQATNLRTTSYTFDFVGAQKGRWRVWAVDGHGLGMTVAPSHEISVPADDTWANADASQDALQTTTSAIFPAKSGSRCSR